MKILFKIKRHFQFKRMIKHMQMRLGKSAAGGFIAIMCDALDKLTEDGDKNIRSIEIKFNDFHSTKFDFVKGEYEDA